MTNHDGIMATIKKKNHATVYSENIERFKVDFETFTGERIEYEETYKFTYRVKLALL